MRLEDIMDYLNIIIPFFGGLGMFIYGMQIMASGLENTAGGKMQSLLEALTKNKFLGVCLGAFITAVIQSSSATTVMVVGFVNAGIMNLTQSMGVIMGANIGTTVTGWLVSSAEWMDFLSPTTLAPVAIMVGVVVMIASKKSKSKEISYIVIGFGLLFVGISTMSDAVYPLRESEVIVDLFVTLGNNPLMGIIVGALVTAVIQSSSASVGILQSLAVAGLVPFSAAVYIIMGQNIGTCITAMLSGMGAKKIAKTAAFMHLLFNIIGSVIFSIGAVVFFEIINTTIGQGTISTTEISIVHTAFNIATTLLLYPASGLIIKLARKMSGLKEEEEFKKISSSHAQLDDRMLRTPSLALKSALTETQRLGELVMDTMAETEKVLFDANEDTINMIRKKESTIDKLTTEITEYTVKLTGLSITDVEREHAVHLLSVVSHLERISDYCENISEFAETLKEKNIEFSKTASDELRNMIEICSQSYTYAYKAMQGDNRSEALKVIEYETKADDLEMQLRARHIKRLTNNQCNIEAGIIFLDSLICLERISDHARSIAEEVLERTA